MGKYQSYKPSGVEWIGEIPEHWRLIKIGYVSELLTGNPWNSELFDYVDGVKIVRGENVSEGFLRWGERTRYWKNEIIKGETYLLKDGDIIIGMDGSKVGKNYVLITQNDLPLLLHQRMSRIRVYPKFLPKFLLYLIGSDMFRYYIDISKTDPMIPHITQKDISDFLTPYPSLTEQHQIVQFLDEKTEIIDKLISTKERKIKLLKEQRTSLINRVITKGLIPNVKMKPSGVEWIGEIPEHWVKRKLKSVSEYITEKGLPNSSDIKISPENVEQNTGVCLNLYSDYTNEGVKFQKGDVLFNKLRVYLSKVLLTNYNGFSMGEMIVVRPKEIDNKYLFHLMLSFGFIDWCNSFNIGVKLPRVSPEVIFNSIIPVPPYTEQKLIVEYIEKHFREINDLVLMEQKKIDLLKEYRQSLISEVITGKIDVRTNVN